MDIKQVIEISHETAFIHEFWNIDPSHYTVPAKLMLIVSELGEAMEADRRGDRAGFSEELADAVIRIADLCGAMDIDLNAILEWKMAINRERPIRHNKLY